jgi:hypothetical protein
MGILMNKEINICFVFLSGPQIMFPEAYYLASSSLDIFYPPDFFQYFIPMKHFSHNIAFKNKTRKLGIVAHACNPSSQEAEAAGLQIPGHLVYIARSYLKKITHM